MLIGCHSVEQHRLYQELVENARIVTGARIVHLYHLDASTQRIHRLATSALTSARIRQALQQIQRLFPGFHPGRVGPHITANAHLIQVYREGQRVQTTIEAISEGVVDPKIVRLAKAVMRLGYVLSIPLVIDAEVVGALTFHRSHAFTRREEMLCQAFVRQVALTIHNAKLLRQAQTYSEEMERSRAMVTQGEDALRRQVADYLHGHVQTQLLIAWHRLGQVEELIGPDNDAAVALVGQVKEILDALREDDVRKLSHLLHPSIIRLGLLPALRTLADSQPGVDVEIEADRMVRRLDKAVDNRIPEAFRLALYRVAEEAITNAWRHGGATRVLIRLSLRRGRLAMRVTDNGRGVDMTTFKPSLGWANIDARVAQTGGTWGLENNVTGGATLWVEVSLENGAVATSTAQ